MNPRKTISLLSLTAGICIFAMFLIAVFTGISQEQFEVTRSVENYKQALLAAENTLRLTFTVDLVFICVFTTLFVFLTQYLKTNDRVTNAIADVVLAAMLICGFLDFFEDLHILTLLRNAQRDLPIESFSISAQMTLSMIKFCASYLSMFLLAFILPSQTFTEKLLKFSLWFVQLPIGVLVFTTDENFSILFNLVRFVFMVLGFFLLAYNFSKDETN
ncbi:MAG: hypothetical protein MUC29_11810 [Pyrinomonadaceae bacterium]|jgi:hypothetical protein|nr:hypothetical protein [Pyrinomonadaceae bacterium]